MSKKKLLNRLENLLVDLEQEASLLPISGDQSIPGWTWECDSNGRYISCSPEVEDVLGIPSADFSGRSLVSFALWPQSATSVQAVFSAGQFPAKLEVSFQCPQGQLVPAKIHVFSVLPVDGEGDEEKSYRGFVQVLQPIKDLPATAAPLTDTEAPEGLTPPEPLPFEPVFPEPSPFHPPQPEPESPKQPAFETLPIEPEPQSVIPELPGKEPTWEHPSALPMIQQELTYAQLGQIAFQPSNPERPATITVPVRMDESRMGLLELIDDTPGRVWTTDERRLVQEISDQLTMALENASLFQAEQRRASELNTLVELSRLISQNLNMEEVYETAHHIIGQLMPTEIFSIHLVDRESNQFIAAYAIDQGERLPASRFSLNEGFSGYVLQTGNAFYSRDLDTEKGSSIIQGAGSSQARSVMAVPLLFSEEIIGVLTTQSDQRNAFSNYDLRLLQTFADHIAIAVQNARLYQQEQRRRQVADTLRDIARVVGSTLDLREVIERMLDQLANLVTYTTASIHLIHKGRRQLIGGRGANIHAVTHGDEQPWHPISDDPLIAEAIQSGLPLVIPDTYADPHWQVRPETVQTRSWVAAPLVAGQEVVGILTLDHTVPGAYSLETAELSSAVAAQAAVAIQNARLFEQSQDTLAETETLYLASAELSTAQSYEDILASLQRHTIAGQDSHHISLNFFDRPWTKEELPQQIDVLARWTSLPGSTFIPRYPFAAFPSLAKLLKTNVPLIVDDFEHDPRVDENARTLYVKRFQSKSALFISIVVSGQWLGFVNASYPEPKTFPEKEIRRLVALVNQAAVAIQNLRNVELAERRAKEAQQRSEELALINRVVSAVVSSPDLHQVLEIMATELVKVFMLDHVGIALLTEDRASLTVVAEKSNTPGPSAVGRVIPVKGNPSSEQVIATRQSLVIQDAQNNPLLAPIHGMMRDRSIETIAILPIQTSGEVVGTVEMEIAEKGRTLSPQALALAETLVGQISTAIQNANLFQQIQNALSETETLYRASAELNAIQNFDDILNILRKSTLLGHPEANHISINLFDRPWVGDDIPESFAPISQWARTPYLDTPNTRSLLRTWPSAKQLLRPDLPVIITDTTNDPRLGKTTGTLFVERLMGQSIIFAPLNVGGKWIGHINGVFAKSLSFSEQQVRRLMALAGQAAIAIQNLRLLEETRQRASQLETAAEIARDTSSTLALDQLLRRAVNMICERYGYYHASIFLLDETGQNAVIRESTGEAGEEMKRRSHKLPVGSRSLIGYVTELGKPLVINDVISDPIHRPNPLLPESRAELGIPLKIGNRVIGALDVQSAETNAFTADDVTVVQTLADQLAVAVDNARSYELAQQAIEETRQRMQELSVLFNVSQALASATMESEEIAHIISQRFIEVMNIPECLITLKNAETGEMHILADLSRPSDGRQDELVSTKRVGRSYPLAEYQAIAQVMESLLPKVIQSNDPNADAMMHAYMRQNGLHTLAMIPMAVKGQAIGVIQLEAWDSSRVFSPDQLNLALILANAAATALENARLYEESLTTTEKLREVDRLKSQFLANMSHELRTPLNSIIGFSRVIIKGIDGPISELQQQDLNAIYSAGQHLLQLINNILDISKIEAGKMELSIEENVNLTDLINGVMSTAVGLVKDKPIRLEKIIPNDLPAVRADTTRIRQVILNLVSNATKFTEQGWIRVEAGVQSNPNGNPEVIIKVNDSGIGIAEADQKRLFLPFSQVDDSPTRKTGGTGLGLSISRLLVEMHGGRIGVESEVGHGSTFFFTLPLPLPEKPTSLEENNRVILAIDDERPILDLYDRYLSEHGYQVLPLSDPLKAVERAKEVKPFAITLDVMMPGHNGWQVLEELKNDPETSHIPVIVCSILEDQAKGFSLGATDYLMKPILEDDLANAINRLNGDGSIQEVLVIDDDENDLRLVEKILQKDKQYHISLAKGGAEGLVSLRSKRPQAVILDLFMPGLDGFSVLETMRADAALKEIPVIIFTAGDLSEDQQQRLSRFSQDMLRKGAKEEDLLASIEKALKRFSSNGNVKKTS